MKNSTPVHLDFETLSDLIDGELATGEAEARRHLTECRECAEAFDALAQAVSLTGALQAEARPDRDLWAGIEARIVPEADKVIPIGTARGEVPPAAPVRRTVAIPLPLAWAAGLALAFFSGTTAWLAIESPTLTSDEAFLAGTSSPGVSFAGADAETDGYALAIDDLEQVLDLARRQLEPETVQTLEASLAEIEAALQEAEAALMSDPGNEVIYRLIAAHERTRYRLLSQAASLLPRG